MSALMESCMYHGDNTHDFIAPHSSFDVPKHLYLAKMTEEQPLAMTVFPPPRRLYLSDDYLNSCTLSCNT
jgi:hypothetical protein